MTLQSIPEPSSTYLNLRNKIFKLNPQEKGITSSERFPHLWGVLMDIGLTNGAVSLVVLVDGTVRLFFANGGTIEGSESPMVQSVAQEFLLSGENLYSQIPPAASFGVPALGRVRFYLLTFPGILSAEAGEDDMAGGDHPLTQLFYEANSVLSELRMVHGKKSDEIIK